MVDYLERRGVEYIFGLCGHTVIGFLDALSRSEKIKYISVRHEQIAATAADGYDRVKHKAAVVLSHLGPGITNTVTGIANAAVDSIPLVLIAGDVPSYYFGKHPHQEVNMHADGSQYEILLWCQFVQRSGSHGLNHFDALPAAEKQIDFITADRLNAIIYVLAVQSTDGKLFILFVRRIKNHVANTLLVFIHVVQKHFQFGRIGIARNHGMPVVKG